MKTKLLLITLIAAFSLILSGPASAHYLYFDVFGPQTATPGGTVSVSVYLHAETADTLYSWGSSMGFDDTAVDGGELTFEDIVFGETVLVPWFTPFVETGTSAKYDGESVIVDIERNSPDWITGEDLSAGDNFLLYTAFFTFDGGVWDGEDIWLEWDPVKDGFDFDSDFYASLDVYTDSTGTTLLGDNGPDYGPGGGEVPIPGAVWLLGSGLLGLAGLRRKKSA